MAGDCRGGRIVGNAVMVMVSNVKNQRPNADEETNEIWWVCCVCGRVLLGRLRGQRRGAVAGSAFKTSLSASKPCATLAIPWFDSEALCPPAQNYLRGFVCVLKRASPVRAGKSRRENYIHDALSFNNWSQLAIRRVIVTFCPRSRIVAGSS